MIGRIREMVVEVTSFGDRDSSSQRSHSGSNYSTSVDRRKRVQERCRDLTGCIGFQADSVRNQVEHIVALWESFNARHGDPDLALEELWSQLLHTYKEWSNKVWRPLTNESQVQEDHLRDVCLFLLLWGELANLRFCPELHLYLFAASRAHFCNVAARRSYRSSLSSSDVPTGLFMKEIVKPIYRVFLKETYNQEPGRAPVFRFGGAPAPPGASNYDDWNELFWDPHRLQRHLKIQRSVIASPQATPVTERSGLRSSLQDWLRKPPPTQVHIICKQPHEVWLRLADVDWQASFEHRKSHLEVHSLFPLLVGHYRIFLAHTVAFVVLLLYYARDWGSWEERAAIGLLAPLWMTFSMVGFQVLTPGLSVYNRIKMLLKLVFVWWLPVMSFVVVVLEKEGWWRFPESVVVLGFKFPVATEDKIAEHIMLAIHFTLSTLVFLMAMSPQTQNLYAWKFFPRLSQTHRVPTMLFWVAVISAKLLFDIMILEYVGEALKMVVALADAEDNDYTRTLLVGTQSFLLVAPAALCFFAGLPLFATSIIAFVGAFRGVRSLRGCRLCLYRRGFGLSSIPRVMCERVIQVDDEERGPRGPTGGVARWWQNTPDSNREAAVDIWNKILEELRERDLISDQEYSDLSFRSAAAAKSGKWPDIPRLLDPWDVVPMNRLPKNKEARRRIITFARSTQMRNLPEGSVRQMPSLTVVVPHYSETIRYTREDLITRTGSSELLRFLVQYYQGEFRNFAERVCSGMARPNLADSNGQFSNSAAAAAADAAVSRDRPGFDEEELYKWASLRMQTLWRTVEGLCNSYVRALEALSKHQEPRLSDVDRRVLLKDRFQLVVAMQQYAKFADPTSDKYDVRMQAATEALLAVFGDFLSIAYISEEGSGEAKRYYSCMIDSTCAEPKNGGMRRPRFKIELPGWPILGNGKSDNQNCAVIYTRGEILQVIDANQDAYFESSLFLPLALQEFNRVTPAGRRPGILGFREHIFSNIGILGKMAADSEFAFGTVVQRTMDWPMESRLHYGHPDMMDKLQIIQQGGVSKATKGLNLSEDVFAGIDLALRGGWTAYREYFHVGKGRDMGFMSVLSFHSKVSMGNGEQAITRQWMRLGLGLPWPRLLGIFYTHVGHYLNQCLLTWSMKAFAFMVAWYGICSQYELGVEGAAIHEGAHYFGYLYFLFVLSAMLPLLLEVNIELGPLQVLYSLGSSLLALDPVFSAFQSKIIAYYFESTVAYGGAQYIPTGRGLGVARFSFVKLYRAFSATHFRDAFEATLYLSLGTIVDCGWPFALCMGLCIFSWSFAPFLYNPKQFSSFGVAASDLREYLHWMLCTRPDRGGEEASWYEWAEKAQSIQKNGYLLTSIIPAKRFICAFCSGALAWAVVSKNHEDILFALLPPVTHMIVCFMFALTGPVGLLQDMRFPATMSLIAVGTTCVELSMLPHDYTLWCVLFHKYMMVRCLMRSFDVVAAHKPGGWFFGPLHEACKQWAFSWRFLRDVFVGIVLSCPCLLFSAIPGCGQLHVFFLYRAWPKKEQKARTRADSFGQAAGVADQLLGNLDTQGTMTEEEAGRLLKNFFGTFAPQVGDMHTFSDLTGAVRAAGNGRPLATGRRATVR
eukprot:TRINITY_DN30951_c0_g1_i1.p1 TRINITY_DN30951_c0_g1~~TRINITY_DN30951_c0_g1_i1.p1  ORF type:complete len:1604 (-),score=362.26 TRINITY_DN30951_c0_g1_i1:181-4992(-)